MLLRLALASSLVLCGACLPDDLDLQGHACDAMHPCPDGLDCCAGTCVRFDGGYQWPQGPAGTLWRQWAEGFEATRAPAGGAVSLAACHTVQAKLHFASEKQAVATSRRALPATPQGKLRGTVTVRLPVELRNTSSFIVLEDAAGKSAVVSLALGPANRLTCSSAPRLLSAAGSSDTSSASLEPGRPHALGLRWKQGAYLELTLDGQVALRTSYTGGAAFDGGAAIPSELRLGIDDYTGAEAHRRLGDRAGGLRAVRRRRRCLAKVRSPKGRAERACQVRPARFPLCYGRGPSDGVPSPASLHPGVRRTAAGHRDLPNPRSRPSWPPIASRT
jgi:hypothetical protein